MGLLLHNLTKSYACFSWKPERALFHFYLLSAAPELISRYEHRYCRIFRLTYLVLQVLLYFTHLHDLRRRELPRGDFVGSETSWFAFFLTGYTRLDDNWRLPKLTWFTVLFHVAFVCSQSVTRWPWLPVEADDVCVRLREIISEGRRFFHNYPIRNPVRCLLITLGRPVKETDNEWPRPKHSKLQCLIRLMSTYCKHS